MGELFHWSPRLRAPQSMHMLGCKAFVFGSAADFLSSKLLCPCSWPSVVAIVSGSQTEKKWSRHMIGDFIEISLRSNLECTYNGNDHNEFGESWGDLHRLCHTLLGTFLEKTSPSSHSPHMYESVVGVLLNERLNTHKCWCHWNIFAVATKTTNT